MKKRIRTIWTGVLCLCPVLALQAGWGDLQEQLRRMVADKKAQVGIAVIVDGRDTLTVNNDVRYPMMSVFKFHQALAVADACGQRGVSFDTLVHIRPDDLRPDTYSPLRDKYPEGNLSLSVGELLKYTLHLSDNNACDILFRVFGGPAATDEYLRSVGLRDFAIEATEDDMHRDLADCYRNWTTPLEAVRLLEWLVSGKAAKGAYRDFIEQTMISCQTGRDRLPAPLAGTKAVIGHKTGTGDRNGKGQIIGTNDIGFVFLPDGRRYSIAVLVRDSEESEQATARIIADVSEAVYRYVSGER